MGQRADAILLLDSILYVLEFKVGDTSFSRHGLDQVTDYALDLKHFIRRAMNCLSSCSHRHGSKGQTLRIEPFPQGDKLYRPLCSNGQNLTELLKMCRASLSEPFTASSMTAEQWNAGRYSPTPTIVEAAIALYKGHGVADIARKDACGDTLAKTSDAISCIIDSAKASNHKSICVCHGRSSAGKTLIGWMWLQSISIIKLAMVACFFLAMVARQNLARGAGARQSSTRESTWSAVTDREARSEVKAFVQNVHHYRDEYLRTSEAPADHIALFDEAQRAWNSDQTIKFMRQKKGQPNFSQSEPEYLISCIDRHSDWGVVVCLVGAGQEINTGEAGIGEWLRAIHRSFPDWRVFISDRLVDSEYQSQTWMPQVAELRHVTWSPSLHLSFRCVRIELRMFRC